MSSFGFETEEEVFGEFGGQGEYLGESEFGQGEYLGEFGEGEYQGEYQGEQFLGGLLGSVLGEADSPLSEVQEMELASELLEIASEEELDQFLGGLIKRVARGVGGIVRSPVGRALGGALKSVAKKALPVVGGALGSFVAPGVGTAIGSKLGAVASSMFEVELEGMDREEQELEVARRYVRFAADAARRAAVAPPTANPRAVVRTAVVTSARRHAPGLVRGTAYARPSTTVTTTVTNGARPRTGRWVRRGRKIVVIGV